MFVMLARVYLCQGDHLFRCSLLCAFLAHPFFKSSEQSGSGHPKGASVSDLSSHSQARADRLKKPLPSSRCDLVRKSCFSHRTHVGNRHRRNCTVSVPVCHPAIGHALHAPLLLFCVSKSRCISRRLSSNICTGTFCASLSRELFRLLRLPSSRPSFYIKGAKIFGIQAKNLPKVFMQRAHKNRHPRRILSARCRHLETALPMEWHRLSASHGSSCKGVCPDASVRKLPPQFAGGTDRLFVFALSSFGPSPAQASDSELHYNWHHSELSMQHFDQDLLLVRLSVPSSPHHCKEPSCQLFLACFQREELILFETSILSRKVAQA